MSQCFHPLRLIGLFGSFSPGAYLQSGTYSGSFLLGLEVPGFDGDRQRY